MDARAKIREFILREALPGESPANLKDDAPLRAGGILDSIKLLELVRFIEQEFGFEIEAHETGDANFGRIDDVVTFVNRRLAAQ